MLTRLRTLLKTAAFAVASPEVLLFLKHFRAGRQARASLFSSAPLVCREVPEARVLVLAPHPDDEVIGVGGIMALHRAHGNRVLIAYLTDDKTPDGPGFRVAEARALGQAFGLEQVFLGGEDARLEPLPEISGRLADIVDEFAPTQIYVPSYLDAHKDHAATGRILHRALRSRPRCNATVYGYEVWTCLPFPNVVFDVTAAQGRKMEMLSHYPSQTRIVDFAHFCSARGGMRHAMHVDSLGHGFAEAFLCCPASAYVELFDALEQGSDGSASR